MQQTVLVTGASAGIGKATAIYLAQSGYTVYGAARRVDKLHELTSYGIKPIALDVTQEESLTACVEQIFLEAGRIDVLVNNAGFGSYGALEDVALSEAKYQLDVNVFGAMRLAQLVLPKMRENRYGKIINVSSVGGKIASPLGGWYHASKFALEALSDALRLEVQSFGINVVVIQPGGTKSEWGTIAVDSLVRVSGQTAYAGLVTAFKKSFEKVAGKVPEPLVIAKLIKTSLEAKQPHTRYSGGYLAKPMLFLRKILSDRLFDRLLLSQLS
jgi:short-subunit dehydrogenase